MIDFSPFRLGCSFSTRRLLIVHPLCVIIRERRRPSCPRLPGRQVQIQHTTGSQRISSFHHHTSSLRGFLKEFKSTLYGHPFHTHKQSSLDDWTSSYTGRIPGVSSNQEPNSPHKINPKVCESKLWIPRKSSLTFPCSTFHISTEDM